MPWEFELRSASLKTGPRMDDQSNFRRDELLDEDLRHSTSRFIASSGGAPGQSWRQKQQEGHQRDPFGGFDRNQESGPFGSHDKDLRSGGRFSREEQFDQEFHSKGLLPHPGVAENNPVPGKLQIWWSLLRMMLRDEAIKIQHPRERDIHVK